MEQHYLIRKRPGKRVRAHIWLGLDTACTMASTGGLNLSGYKITEPTLGLDVCIMCLNNQKKMTKAYEDALWLTTDKPRVTLAELEAFMEKVAIKIDAGISESEARDQAYAEIILSKVVR